jgi:hypothetical protein
MKYFMHCRIFILILWATCVLCDGCRRDETPSTSLDTIRPSIDTINRQDTSKAKADTTHSNLPPIAKVIEPDRLASFLPKMIGWNPVGELQKEIQIRDTFNRSRVSQTYSKGTKTLKVQIDDFAFVPYLYTPWTKFSGTFLDDNNDERTETTIIAGYRAVQSMEKKEPHGEVTVFPGNRYVVSVVEDGAESINEVRMIAESMDLKGLERLQ